MIASIYQVLKRAASGENLPEFEAADKDIAITRSNFLRVMALGGLTMGVAACGEQELFAKPAAIAPVTDLDKLYDAWQDRFNAGDVEALADLYVSDVAYVDPNGQSMTGKALVRDNLAGLLALKPQIVLGNRKHIVYHDTALTTNHWKMSMTGADGVKQELTGGGIEVLRKQADGGWRYIIDDASRSAS